MISLREIQAIVQNYPADCRPTEIKPLGSAGGMSGAQFWRVQTPRGALVLRQWPIEHPSAERLRLIHQVLCYAAERGITFLAVPIQSKSRESFVREGGHLWELAPWMPGAADYEQSPTSAKLRAAMTGLAGFHVAVCSFPCAGAGGAAIGVPAVSQRLARLKEISSGGIATLARSIDNAIWPELVSQARQFLALLPKCLPRATEQLAAVKIGSLDLQPCLRDIWHDHVLFSGEAVSGIVDYGAIDFDTPATDIARLLGSLVGDDAVGWQNGVAAYSEVRALSSEEERAAKALDASGTIIAGCNWLQWIYVDGRQFENPPQIVSRFRRIVKRCTPLAA